MGYQQIQDGHDRCPHAIDCSENLITPDKQWSRHESVLCKSFWTAEQPGAGKRLQISRQPNEVIIDIHAVAGELP